MFEITLWLLSCGWAVAAQGHSQVGGEEPRAPRGGPPEDPRVTQAIQEFPGYAEGQIQDVKAIDPQASTWKDVIAYAPFLTESVAMWYVLQDPAVPNMVKLEVAAAILYAISPYDGDWFPMLGWTDDAAFLTYVFWKVYEHITPEHIEKAKAWLVAHGVDPKPIFALHKEFDEPKVLEDAVEVGPQLPEKMGAVPGPLDLMEIERLTGEIGTIANSGLQGSTRDPFPLLYPRMEAIGRMLGYSDFLDRRSTNLRHIGSVALSARDAAVQLGREGTVSKAVGLKKYLLTNLMSQLAQLAGAVAFGSEDSSFDPLQ